MMGTLSLIFVSTIIWNCFIGLFITDLYHVHLGLVKSFLGFKTLKKERQDVNPAFSAFLFLGRELVLRLAGLQPAIAINHPRLETIKRHGQQDGHCQGDEGAQPLLQGAGIWAHLGEKVAH